MWGGVPGPDKQPHEVDLGVLVLRDHHFVTDSCRWRPAVSRGGRTVTETPHTRPERPERGWISPEKWHTPPHL